MEACLIGQAKALQTVFCLRQVWWQSEGSWLGLTPFTVQVQNGAVCVQGQMLTLGTVLADRAWGAPGQRDQKWVSS